MTMVPVLLCTFAGAFAGGMLRYGFSWLLPSPVSTFASNVLGSLAAGVCVGLLALSEFPREDLISAAAAAGFAGGLSTWSTMAKELAEMLKAQRYRDFTLYLGFSVAIGIVAAWRGGLWAARIAGGF